MEKIFGDPYPTYDFFSEKKQRMKFGIVSKFMIKVVPQMFF